MKSGGRLVRLLLLFLPLLLVTGALRAQQPAPDGSPPQVQQAEGQTAPATAPKAEGHEESGGGANAAIGKILEGATETAAHRAESWGRVFHLGHDTSYLVSLLLNFVTIVLLFYFLFRAKIPAMFRDRTNSIQAAIRDARAASAEATERLKGVEARLAKLDGEVAGIRAEAEKQAALEEERIRAAAEEDKRRIVESAKMEIDAAARNARRDLKSYASGLAVDIAGKRIKVDESADRVLVREFVDQIGKDGH